MVWAISGGAGFLGLHLARRLIADGHEVRSLDLVGLEDTQLEGRVQAQQDLVGQLKGQVDRETPATGQLQQQLSQPPVATAIMPPPYIYPYTYAYPPVGIGLYLGRPWGVPGYYGYYGRPYWGPRFFYRHYGRRW